MIQITTAGPSTTSLPSSLNSTSLPTSLLNSTLLNSTAVPTNSTSRLVLPTSAFTLQTPLVPPPLSSANATAEANRSGSHKDLSKGAVAGISVAAVVGFLALLALLGIVFWRRRKAAERDDALDDSALPSV